MPLVRDQLLFLFLIFSYQLLAQGFFSGDLEIRADFYDRDSTINASNTPHYDNLKNSLDLWMNLSYYNSDIGLEAGVRVEGYLNSNIHNPGSPYTGIGIGRYYIKKRFKDFTFTGGHLYDQIGSGIVYRSFEERFLGIDNPLLGARVEYNHDEKYFFKAFGGLQKWRFQLYQPVIVGAEARAAFHPADGIQINPGIGVLNRTLDQESMDFIVSNVETYDPDQRFVPEYNVYVFNVFNNAIFKDFTWYVEAAYKTEEAINSAIFGDEARIIHTDGNILYSTLTYSRKGFGITGIFKRTENFALRTSPRETLLRGLLNFIPPVNRQNSLRLPARYQPAALELEELAFGGELTWQPVRGYVLTAEYSDMRDFSGQQLYREAYIDLMVRKKRSWKLLIGGHYMQYNQFFYEGKGVEGLLVEAITPFTEFTYKIDRKKSIRIELQQQFTEEDYGSWLYGLVEFNIAPRWSFSVSDMWNYNPNPTNPKISEEQLGEDFHYWTVFGALTLDSHRFSLGYVKQVEGIICTGGVCRLEPAFSGVRFTLNSTF